jgi:hypothetical protein
VRRLLHGKPDNDRSLNDASRSKAAPKRPLPNKGRAEGMKRLWSQAGTTGGNRSQMPEPRKRLK